MRSICWQRQAKKPSGAHEHTHYETPFPQPLQFDVAGFELQGLGIPTDATQRVFQYFVTVQVSSEYGSVSIRNKRNRAVLSILQPISFCLPGWLAGCLAGGRAGGPGRPAG